MLDLRRSGQGYGTIAKQLGIDKNQVIWICRKNGVSGFIAEDNKLTEATVADIVSRSGFDYVGGYQMMKKPITVRCRVCGRTFDRQAHVFRDVANGTWKNKNECPLCRQDRIAESRRERSEKKEHDARIIAEFRAESKAALISLQLVERLATRVCRNCGNEYCIETTGYNSKSYCSEKCMKRWAMRIKNDRRLKRMKRRVHDNDITLEKLFNNSNGICYLCGKPCDWDDIVNGNAGDSYPSIDHVIPLSKGGTHTWDNVKLAHRSCNLVKRDSIYAPVR